MKRTPLREGRFYGLLALAFVVLAGADVLYYSSADAPESNTSIVIPDAEAPAAPVVIADAAPGACGYNAEIAPVEDYAALVSTTDYTEGAADAPVTVIEFFEPNCPHCRTFYPAMKQVMAANKNNARFVIKPVIFWPKSALQGQALYAAQQEGKFKPMLEAQFANPKPNGLAEADLRAIASGIGMDADAMMEKISGRAFTTQLYRMREAFEASGNNTVPAVLINGRTVDGNSRTAECLNYLIREAAQSGTE